jgi:hypothetical protein
MAQPEDGSVRGAETCCCYKWFNYLLIVITEYKVVLDCAVVCILLFIEHNGDVSTENNCVTPPRVRGRPFFRYEVNDAGTKRAPRPISLN